MAVHNFNALREHVGHRIVCVAYGNPPVNVALECERCNVVLLDFDAPAPRLPKMSPSQKSVMFKLQHGWTLMYMPLRAGQARFWYIRGPHNACEDVGMRTGRALEDRGLVTKDDAQVNGYRGPWTYSLTEAGHAVQTD